MAELNMKHQHDKTALALAMRKPAPYHDRIRSLASAAKRANTIRYEVVPVEGEARVLGKQEILRCTLRFIKVPRKQILNFFKKELKPISPKCWYLSWDDSLWIGTAATIQLIKKVKEKQWQIAMRAVKNRETEVMESVASEAATQTATAVIEDLR